MIISIIILALILPYVAIVLDKRDYNDIQEGDISSDELVKIARNKNEPIEKIIYKKKLYQNIL
jgi:hypothetical protein